MHNARSPRRGKKSPPNTPKGMIEFANCKAGRYAVSTSAERYTIFQVLSAGAPLNVGETINGELETLTLQIYSTGEHGRISVFAEAVCCIRSAAKAWVRAG